jgi:uncharacterized RDD family membrane protein YckC
LTLLAKASSGPDLEGYDASEERFAASLESKEPAQLPKFVPQVEAQSPDTEMQSPDVSRTGPEVNNPALLLNDMPEADAATPPVEDPLAWKREVSSRVNQYRARRRPKPPRYPSLALKFDHSPTEWRGDAVVSPSTAIPASRQSVAMDSMPVIEGPVEVRNFEIPRAEPPSIEPGPGAQNGLQMEEPQEVRQPRALPSLRDALAEVETAKIIEFPRFGIAPPMPLDELAGPVLDRPRILEVPEVELPPPALGGILIEPEEEFVEEKRPGIEVPLQSARMSRRFLAAATDGVIVLAAMALFLYLVFRIIQTVPALPQTLAFGGLITGVFWAGYHYLFLVYGGTTPGLRLAKLRLSCFDGAPVCKALRRWRALASILSAIALGLGYAWCFLDEDQLCWHDRATHTYLAPVVPKSAE